MRDIERATLVTLERKKRSMPVINIRMSRQAIETKYIGPGNVRGSRIKASCQAGSIIRDFDQGKSIDQRHADVAMELAAKFGWQDYRWVQGGSPSGNGSVFVCLED
jgi:hypothetical protein